MKEPQAIGFSPGRCLAAECLGTAMLLAAVVGSGIMGDRLAGGSPGLALLANTIATGAALVALILAFGRISGAHLNPAVTMSAASQGAMSWSEARGYVAAVVGALAGVALANLMFDEPLFALSEHACQGCGQLLGEFVATFGLLATIHGCSRLHSAAAVPFAVAAWITAAYWFTASTSFANPAVTVARSLTNTFTGIRPADVPGFVAAQLLGATAATALFRWLVPTPAKSADRLPARIGARA